MLDALSQSSNELDLLDEWSRSPLAFVLAVFPWQQPGTILEGRDGPYPWQRAELEAIGAALGTGHKPTDVIRRAISSGHGVGKSALVAWLILWAVNTYPYARGVVTANTENQLRTKTWAEVGKWHALLPAALRSAFTVTATAIMSTEPGADKTWRIDAIAWSDTNTEAFAGLHNAGRRILVIYDEASAVSDAIWEVTEGALTDADTEIIWVACGNPTRATGRFTDTWGRFKARWHLTSVDSRQVPGVNLEQINQWLEDYGEDSDFFRVRVRGLPPRASATGFFDAEKVSHAMTKEAQSFLNDPLVMSVDVARGGNAECVIAFRRGMDARTLPWIIIPGSEVRDSTKLIDRITDLATTTDQFKRPDAILVDETGVGGPIVDRLRQLLGDHTPVYGVNFARKSPEAKHANMRMTMHWRLREALGTGLALPLDPILERELLAIEYTHDRSDRMILTPKDRMMEELGFSPDRGDAIAISFAKRVEKRSTTAVQGNQPISIRRDVDPRE